MYIRAESIIGRYQGKKVNQLNDLIEDFGFKSFIYEPGYEFITDGPSCITTIKYSDGETKEINHYYGHVLIDDSLTAFEKNIERIIGTKICKSQIIHISGGRKGSRAIN